MNRLVAVLGIFLCVGSSAWGQDIPTLRKQLKDQDATVRRDAAKSLADLGKEAKPALNDLIQALKDKDTFVRRFSAQAIGEIGRDAQSALPALKAAMNDPKKEVVDAAANALGKIGSGGVDTLVEQLKDKKNDMDLRRRAAETLGKLGEEGKAGVPALLDAMKERDLQTTAMVALGEIGPAAKEAVKPLQEIVQAKGNQDIRRLAQATLRKIQSKK